MHCKTCNASGRIIHVTAKCSDLCCVEFPDGTQHDGYVPDKIGIGGGDYIEFKYCMLCGQIQETFPVRIPNQEDEDE